MKAAVLYTLIFILSLPLLAKAQEENAVAIKEGKKYLSINVKSLDKYNKRVTARQERLINNLKKKEDKIGKKLKRKDSLAYVRYVEQSLTFDSIKHFMHSDSLTKAKSLPKKKNAKIDSLKGVAHFTEDKAIEHKNNKDVAQVKSYKDELAQQQQQLNYHDHINNLITQRTQNLKTLAATSKSKIPGLTSIEKKAYYGKEQIKVYKAIADEPTRAEDKALEYLQGTEGFDGAVDNAVNGKSKSVGKNENPADLLEKEGMQTKRQLQKSLKEKYGGNLDGIADKAGGQVKEWQDKSKGLKEKVNKGKESISKAKDTKKTVQQTKASLKVDKPEFKINPMRKLPFWQRIETQYNWQTTRPSLDGIPAKLDASAMAAFRHTEKLKYGVGLVGSLGMGQGWSDLKLSFEGIGIRTFANWEWQYGIGAYAGYERMYKSVVFTDEKETVTAPPTTHNNKLYSENVIMGLTKNYHINDKWTGQIQLLYDIWWQQKGLRSPITIRFATTKK